MCCYRSSLAAVYLFNWGGGELEMRAICAVWLVMFSVSAWGQTAPPGSTPTQAPASSSPADADQTQGPVTTLKVVTRIVAISAVVKSKDGEAKTGLTKDDFVLKQDAKEVPIRYFSVGSELPLTIALM